VVRLLLANKADPYARSPLPEAWTTVIHQAAFSGQVEVVRALLESGKLTGESLGMMLFRKVDGHDAEGIRLLLAAGADPSAGTRWGFNALHHAIRRDNALDNVRLMLAHGADPTLASQADGRSAIDEIPQPTEHHNPWNAGPGIGLLISRRSTWEHDSLAGGPRPRSFRVQRNGYPGGT
jgi:ankyrin repeat protein